MVSMRVILALFLVFATATAGEVDLRVNSKGPSAITAVWIIEDQAFGSAVTSYKISWSGGSTGSKVVPSSGYTTEIDGLYPCSIYNVTIQSFFFSRQIGRLSWDTAKTNTRNPMPVSSVNVTTVKDNPQQLDVSWNLTSNIGNCPGYYKVSWSISGSDDEQSHLLKNTLMYSIIGLIPGTSYQVCVDAGIGELFFFNSPRCAIANTIKDDRILQVEDVAILKNEVNSLRENQLVIMKDLARLKNTSIIHGEIVREGNIQGLQDSLSLLNTRITNHGNEQESSQVWMRDVVTSLRDNQITIKEELLSMKNAIIAQDNQLKESEARIWDVVNSLRDNQLTITEELTKVTIIHGCEEEGKIVIQDDCSITVCYQGFLHPYQGSSAPNMSILELKNCIHLVTSHKTWDDARDNCRAMGGDLFVAGDLQGLLHIPELVTLWRANSSVWIGARFRTWLDDRDVAESEWESGRPNDAIDSCGNAALVDVTAVLDDDPCTETWPSLCHIGITY